MKKKIFLFLVTILSAIFISSCTKMPEIAPGSDGTNQALVTGISVKGATVINDTIQLRTNETYIFQMKRNGEDVAARFLFGDGDPLTENVAAATHKYLNAGVYTIVAITKEDATSTLNVRVVSEKASLDEIVVIGSKVVAADNQSCNFKLLFRADALYDNGENPVSTVMLFYKTTNTYWKDTGYVMNEIVTLNGIKYYAYNVRLKRGEFIYFIYRTISAYKWSWYKPSDDHKIVGGENDGLYGYQVTDDWELL